MFTNEHDVVCRCEKEPVVNQGSFHIGNDSFIFDGSNHTSNDDVSGYDITL